jgi:hypothetical protein
LVVEQAALQDRHDSPYQPLCCQRRQVLSRLALAAAFPDREHRLSKHAIASLKHGTSSTERLYRQQAADRGLRFQIRQERRERCVHPLSPARLPLVGGEHALGELLQRVLNGHQKAVLAAVKMLVERTARHAGALDHMRDGYVGGATLGARFAHREEYPCALDLTDLRSRQAIVAANRV